MTSALNDTLKLSVASRALNVRRDRKQANVFLFIESMPYGGVGTARLGNYYGKYGYDSLTHAKSILISPPDAAIDHLFPPYNKEKVQALDQ
jgi:aldehyde dehydrogenase (NAD+)